MKLPLPLLNSPFFLFTSKEEFLKAMGDILSPLDILEIERLTTIGLPPVISRTALATMFGINPGLIRSFENHTDRYYRSFTIPKGNSGKLRTIDAPRVGLKIIQKWFSVQLEKTVKPLPHVFGFVNGRSHLDAAIVHCNAQWILSVDILDFFQTTPKTTVQSELKEIGFGQVGAELFSNLTCFKNALAQGAPSSPVLSNLCFKKLDIELHEIALRHDARLTRYADDIVFSGTNSFSKTLIDEVQNLFLSTHWQLAAEKTKFAASPDRLKVHGLLVHGKKVQLTKGYRNKLRAFAHLTQKNAIKDSDRSRIQGHLNYQIQVERKRSS